MHITARRILVAVDFSEASAGAIRLAGALATGLHGALTALHAEVIEAPPYFTHEQLDALEAQRVEARRAAAAFLERFVLARTNVAVEPLIVERPPVEAILGVASAADLVVMGTHGRRGPSRWWLGSVAERVVRAASVPVLVVQGTQAAATPSGAFRHLLVGRAHGAPIGRAREWAGELAAAFNGTIEITDAIEACERSTIEAASLLVLAVPAPQTDGTIGSLEASVLRTCGRPVLFVPTSA